MNTTTTHQPVSNSATTDHEAGVSARYLYAHPQLRATIQQLAGVQQHRIALLLPGSHRFGRRFRRPCPGDVRIAANRFREAAVVARPARRSVHEGDEFLCLLPGILGAGHRETDFDEYIGGVPLFLAYSPGGEVLFPAAERAAPLSPGQLATRGPMWTRT